MFDKDKAIAFAARYGDDAYRFAFIVTLSKDAAEQAVCSAFEALSADEKFQPEEPDKRVIFAAVYKFAKKSAITEVKREEIEALYGEKPDEFFEIAAMPLKARAAEHLTLYEGYGEKEAEEILKGRIND